MIGRKRFSYDLWGDAVNTASRMESHGTPGRIQITRRDVRAAQGRLRVRAAGHGRGQGQGRDGDLVPGRAAPGGKARTSPDLIHPDARIAGIARADRGQCRHGLLFAQRARPSLTHGGSSMLASTSWTATGARSSPRAEDENAFLERHAWDEYGELAPGAHRRGDGRDQGRYAFVYGDFRRVHRTGLIACRTARPSGVTRRSSSLLTTSSSTWTRRAPDPGDLLCEAVDKLGWLSGMGIETVLEWVVGRRPHHADRGHGPRGDPAVADLGSGPGRGRDSPVRDHRLTSPGSRRR